MTFKPLYYQEKLSVLNPSGDIGVITLWSPVRQVLAKVHERAPELMATNGRFAVAGNLYGDGFFAMLCNLLYNPQIVHLIAVGQDLTGVVLDLEAFLAKGTEPATILGQKVRQIIDRQRYIPDVEDFQEKFLRERLSFKYFGKLSQPGIIGDIKRYCSQLPLTGNPGRERVRVEVPSPTKQKFSFKPSNLAGHQVIRRRPLECWRELVVRTLRFGTPVTLDKGVRIELHNVKVVVGEPIEETDEQLAAYNFDADAFVNYQEDILKGDLPENISYTYGHRLRRYFTGAHGTIDTLEFAIARLTTDPETRHAYISLWDTGFDLSHPTEPDARTSVPCLVTIFFRKIDGRLTLTATYRSHNLLTAWLQNVYGLIAIQRYVASSIGLEQGPVTVISHSLAADPASTRYPLGLAMLEAWNRDDDEDPQTGKPVLREDPNGYFTVSIDESERTIIVDHLFDGILVKRYEATKAEEIERAVASDMAISVVSHAMWLGRELARAEANLGHLSKPRPV